jgi:hypothetical protein
VIGLRRRTRKLDDEACAPYRHVNNKMFCRQPAAGLYASPMTPKRKREVPSGNVVVDCGEAPSDAKCPTHPAYGTERVEAQ